MDFFVWDIDPTIFTFGNGAGPRYYGLMFAIAFIVGYKLLAKIFLAAKIKEEVLSTLLYHVIFGTLIGARLGHCLFYQPDYYLSRPWEILFIWKGGLASHGGTIGIVASVWLFHRKNPNIGYVWLADKLAPAIAFGAACIRIGNFFNSEILGKPTQFPLAIIFKRIDMLPRHPAMLYEAMCYLLLFLVLQYRQVKLKDQMKPASQIGIMFIWIFTGRFFIEFVKENQVSFEGGMFVNMGQLLSIPFIALGLYLTLRKLPSKGISS